MELLWCDDPAENLIYGVIYRQWLGRTPRLSVLEVGCSESNLLPILRGEGLDVVGTDFRPYSRPDYRPVEPNFPFVRGDFLAMPERELLGDRRRFDFAVEVSACEHFGCGYYGEPPVTLCTFLVNVR